jgi:hypothetical protein
MCSLLVEDHDSPASPLADSAESAEGSEPGGAPDWAWFDPGRYLSNRRQEMDRGEAGWLDVLSRFDRAEEWRDDGMLSCVDWLRSRCRLARPTAYEKLRVARQMHARPLLAAAFRSGRIGYSATRVIARLEDTTPEVDEALVVVAESGTVEDLERACRAYRLYRGQDQPDDPVDRRGVRLLPGVDGTGSVQVGLTDVELEEFRAALDAFLDLRPRPDDSGSASPVPDAPVSAAADTHGPKDPAAAAAAAGAAGVADSGPRYAAADTPRPEAAAGAGSAGAADSGPLSAAADTHGPEAAAAAGASGADGGFEADLAAGVVRPIWHRRADAFMNMVRTALAHAHDGHAMGGDRYMVHATVDISNDRDNGALLDGTPLSRQTMDRILCDCSIVGHLLDGDEPLQLGRKSRDWNTAQRRAIRTRDRDHCRFLSCDRRYTEIHHLDPWEDGGFTDVANGALHCPGHHHLLHEGGFTVTGDANGTLTYCRPDGTVIGTSNPPGPARLF